MTMVFVVDDDPAVLRVVGLSLRVEGFEVSTFPSGLPALAALAEKEHPNAIVLDLNMPEVDGREFFRMARQAGYQNPVLIMSAFDAGTACRELGADDWLAKPFAPMDLARKVRELASESA
jgi:DNA-binding response OmpR family regulator